MPRRVLLPTIYPFRHDLSRWAIHQQSAEGRVWVSLRELEEVLFFFGEMAEAEGWFLAIPAGDARAPWWTPVGSGNVLSILDETRRTYDIDENRVFATGFSDGGSGSFYLALTAPTVLAGAIPLNGHIAVAQAGGLQVHLRNLVNVPIYAVNRRTTGSTRPTA